MFSAQRGGRSARGKTDHQVVKDYEGKEEEKGKKDEAFCSFQKSVPLCVVGPSRSPT